MPKQVTLIADSLVCLISDNRNISAEGKLLYGGLSIQLIQPEVAEEQTYQPGQEIGLYGKQVEDLHKVLGDLLAKVKTP